VEWDNDATDAIGKYRTERAVVRAAVPIPLDLDGSNSSLDTVTLMVVTMSFARSSLKVLS